MRKDIKGEKNDFLIKPEPIVLAKSFLCLNCVFGCRNDCVYCYKHNWDFEDKFRPQQLFSPKEIIDNLLSHHYYSPRIPLAIHNSATDPFQEGVKEITFEILKGLEKRQIKNIVGLITKEYLGEADLRQLEHLKYVRPIVFLTYSGLPRKIERVVNERRMESMRNLEKSKIKKVLYFRPVIKGINDSRENVRRIVKLGEKYFDCLVRSSIKLDVHIIDYMAKKGIFLDSSYDIGLNLHDSLKKMLPETRETIDEELSKSKTPFFKKTSCAISWAFGQPDYNTHWIRKDIYCSPNCPSQQKARCRKANLQKINKDWFQKLLVRIDRGATFKVNPDFISVSGKKLCYSDIKFLRMVVNFPVLIEKNGEFLTAEELDIKYNNADRQKVRRFLKKEMGVQNY